MEPSVLKEQENEVKPVGGRRMLSHSLGVLGKEVDVGLGVGSVQGTKLTPRGFHAACILLLQAEVFPVWWSPHPFCRGNKREAGNK